MTVTALQQKQNNLVAMLSRAKSQMELALPKHLNPDRMLRIAMTEVRKNPKLAECDPLSFVGAVIQSAQLGLEIGSGLDLCYIIPYKNEVNFQLGYKGAIELVRRSGKISVVNAFLVGPEDEFIYGFDLAKGGEQIMWTPKTIDLVRDQSNTTYAVAHAKFISDGSVTADPMTNADIEKIRSMSQSKNGPAWKNSWGEMAKKTAILRLSKKLPKSAEVALAIELDHKATVGEAQNLAEVAKESGVTEEMFDVKPVTEAKTETNLEEEI